MKRTRILAVAFGVMVMGLATAQQQPPGGGGGTQPSFYWATVLGYNGGQIVSPRFHPDHDNVPTKYGMNALGKLTFYSGSNATSTELKYRAGINGVWPDE